MLPPGCAGQISEEVGMSIVRTAVVLVGALLLSLPVLAADALRTGDIALVITGFKNAKGMARIQVMDSEQAYTNESKALCLIRSRIIDGKVQLTLKGLPYGRYAVAVFHDENGNGVLDKKLMGIPKEAYGTSNNGRGRFGPPDYHRISFDLNAPEVVQEIAVQ